MIALLRAEWRKLFTTRLWWGMLLGAVVFTALSVIAQLATNGLARSEEPLLQTGVEQRAILASASTGYIFSLVVGIIFMTTEFRHFTSRPTFLTEPHRGRVIAAKLIMGAGLGILYGLVCSAVAAVITIPWYSAKGVTMDWVGNDLFLIELAVMGVIAIYAVVGVGIGVLIRNQISAVIAALVYLFIVESLLRGLGALWTWLADIDRFLPGAAAAAVTQIGGRANSTETFLAPWAGALVLSVWGLFFAVLGWASLVHRDIA